MDNALKSQEFKSLFKSASYDEASAEDKKHEHSDECDCDDKKDEAMADDAPAGLNPSNAFDVAFDSLLTASAALDEVGMANGSQLSLKLASLVVEAKKGKSAKDKVSKEMKKQDKELDKTRVKEEKDAETKRTKDLEKKEKEKLQKGKDRAKALAAKEKEKKDKAEKSGKVKFK